MYCGDKSEEGFFYKGCLNLYINRIFFSLIFLLTLDFNLSEPVTKKSPLVDAPKIFNASRVAYLFTFYKPALSEFNRLKCLLHFILVWQNNNHKITLI